MTISAEYNTALISRGFLKVSLSLNLVHWFFMCMLLLPAVDTHYPNMVKIEIVLAQIANNFFRHSTYFRLRNAAVCIFSDITQETGNVEVSSLPLSDRQ